MNIKDLVRKNVLALKPFSSARAEFTGMADVLLDANESPYENQTNRYPDPYQKELKNKIAKWKNINAKNIFLGNGSDEIIDLLVRTFCEPQQDVMRYIYPSFGMYEVVADINDVAKHQVTLTADFQLDVAACLANQTQNDKILFLCTPNNPTGNSLHRKDLLKVIKNFNGIVVVDEAYIDFSDSASLIYEVENYDNLVVLQTFSKALGAAGLRLGIGYASEEVLSYLNKIKMPYNIGTLVQSRALKILDDLPQIKERVATLKTEKARMRNELSQFSFVQHVFPSDANFLLIQFDDSQTTMNYLTTRKIIVRDRSKLKGCENCLRLTIGSVDENDRVLMALEEMI